jgi:hypothetical protein
MALTDEEKAQLEALQQKDAEPANDDDFDVEIWDETGAGAKVPFREGKKFLARFGIGIEEPLADSSKPDGKSKAGSGSAGQAKPEGTATRYFGKSK